MTTRKTTWKDMSIRSHDNMRQLQSSYLSNTGAWKDYTVELDMGNGWVLTNLPWTELRAWFRFAGVRFPRNFLTSKEHPYPEQEEPIDST